MRVAIRVYTLWFGVWVLGLCKGLTVSLNAFAGDKEYIGRSHGFAVHVPRLEDAPM